MLIVPQSVRQYFTDAGVDCLAPSLLVLRSAVWLMCAELHRHAFHSKLSDKCYVQETAVHI